jgi:hypothetical protein
LKLPLESLDLRNCIMTLLYYECSFIHFMFG